MPICVASCPTLQTLASFFHHQRPHDPNIFLHYVAYSPNTIFFTSDIRHNHNLTRMFWSVQFEPNELTSELRFNTCTGMHIDDNDQLLYMIMYIIYDQPIAYSNSKIWWNGCIPHQRVKP